MLPVPQMQGPGPGMAQSAKSGDIKTLMVDSLRGMMAAAEQHGLDFNSILDEAKSAVAKPAPAAAPPIPR